MTSPYYPNQPMQPMPPGTGPMQPVPPGTGPMQPVPPGTGPMQPVPPGTGPMQPGMPQQPGTYPNPNQASPMVPNPGQPNLAYPPFGQQPQAPMQPSMPQQAPNPQAFGQPFSGGSIFDGMANEDPSQTGNYLPLAVSTYIVEVERMFYNQGRQSTAVITDFKILWSSNPQVQAGSSWNWYQSCAWEGWKGRIKGFIGACNGVDPYDKDALKRAFTDEQGRDTSVSAAEFAVSQHNPLMGKVLRLDTAPAATKKGGQITSHKWRPYRPEEFQGQQ